MRIADGTAADAELALQAIEWAGGEHDKPRLDHAAVLQVRRADGRRVSRFPHSTHNELDRGRDALAHFVDEILVEKNRAPRSHAFDQSTEACDMHGVDRPATASTHANRPRSRII